MTSWRESLNSIPGALSNLINESATIYNNVLQSLPATPTQTPTTTASTSGDENVIVGNDYKALPIPATLVKEQWRLIFTSDANATDLQAAISHCRDLVLLSDECSEERRWLVRHLVDLRYSLKELEDAAADDAANDNSNSRAQQQQQLMMLGMRTVVGHHFVIHQPGGNRLQAAAKRFYCDHCTGIIWSVVQASYACSDCGFMVHQKCIDSVLRVCAHVIASERKNGRPIEEICPEIGLAAQRYKCAECSTLLNFKNSWIEPRLCDYTGLYYCPSCHWNDQIMIPARIVHNWDFTPRRVSRAALQELTLFMDMPLIRLEEANPKLFVFLEKLCAVKKLRQNLVHMRKYLAECKLAIDEKLIDLQIGLRRHLIQSNEFYSITDLAQTESGVLAEFLHKIYNAFELHIRQCNLCTAKAYICEICANNEVIFPFDDGCVSCDKCNSIFHRVCITRKNNICPKCTRIQERRLLLERATSDEHDNDED